MGADQAGLAGFGDEVSGSLNGNAASGETELSLGARVPAGPASTLRAVAAGAAKKRWMIMVECTIKKYPVLGYAGLTEVPWGIMIGHEQQAIQNHSQTLERLAERGGLHPIEMACVLSDRAYMVKLGGQWMELSLPKALAIIDAHVKKFERHNGQTREAFGGAEEERRADKQPRRYAETS